MDTRLAPSTVVRRHEETELYRIDLRQSRSSFHGHSSMEASVKSCSEPISNFNLLSKCRIHGNGRNKPSHKSSWTAEVRGPLFRFQRNRARKTRQQEWIQRPLSLHGDGSRCGWSWLSRAVRVRRLMEYSQSCRSLFDLRVHALSSRRIYRGETGASVLLLDLLPFNTNLTSCLDASNC